MKSFIKVILLLTLSTFTLFAIALYEDRFISATKAIKNNQPDKAVQLLLEQTPQHFIMPITYLQGSSVVYGNYKKRYDAVVNSFLENAKLAADTNGDLAFFVGSTIRNWSNINPKFFGGGVGLPGKSSTLEQIKFFKIAAESASIDEIRKLSAKVLGNIYFYGYLGTAAGHAYWYNRDVGYWDKWDYIDFNKAKKYYKQCIGHLIMDCRINYVSALLQSGDVNKAITLLEDEHLGYPDINTSDTERHLELTHSRHTYLWAIYKFGLFGVPINQAKASSYIDKISQSNHWSKTFFEEYDKLNSMSAKEIRELANVFGYDHGGSQISDISISEYLPASYKTKIFLLKKAVSLGDGEAAYHMYNMYSNGNGVNKDILKSLAYLYIGSKHFQTAPVVASSYIFDKSFFKTIIKDEEKELTKSHIIYAQQLAIEILSKLKKSNVKNTNKSKNVNGTGFIISRDGHIVTNQHVVDECKFIKVNKNGTVNKASLIVEDVRNDIALLKSVKSNNFAYIRGGRGIRQGDDIIVYGYPLSNILSSSAKVTTGVVNSLSGMGDDFRYMQISAPVQQGNSGGPLFDKGGNVVGIVTSKLNAAKIQKATGDTPQNINFALKASVFKDMLDANEINYETRSFRKKLNTSDIAKEAKTYTIQIQCIK